MKKDVLNKKIERIVEKYKYFFGLSNWSFSIKIIDLKKDQFAEVDSDGEQRHATIKIHKNIELSELQNTLIHELLHVLFEDNFHEVNEFNDFLISSLRRYHDSLRTSGEEKLIYQLSYIISKKERSVAR